MATQAQVNEFIETLGTLASKEAVRRKNVGLHWTLPSVCIAQAAIETGWGTSALMIKALAYFGIKATEDYVNAGGKYYNSATQECRSGVYEDIRADFKAYDSLEESVADYFHLICEWDNYADAWGLSDARACIEGIQNADNDPGEYAYATSPTYIDNIMNIVDNRNLRVFDAEVIEATEPIPLTIEPDEEPVTTAHNVGDEVPYTVIYASSDSEEALDPYYTTGVITKIIPGARNPYRIGEGTGYINDDSIASEEPEPVEETPTAVSDDINDGDRVYVTQAINYDTGKPIKCWRDTYIVKEHDGDRMVLVNDDRETFSAVHRNNLAKV